MFGISVMVFLLFIYLFIWGKNSTFDCWINNTRRYSSFCHFSNKQEIKVPFLLILHVDSAVPDIVIYLGFYLQVLSVFHLLPQYCTWYIDLFIDALVACLHLCAYKQDFTEVYVDTFTNGIAAIVQTN